MPQHGQKTQNPHCIESVCSLFLSVDFWQSSHEGQAVSAVLRQTLGREQQVCGRWHPEEGREDRDKNLSVEAHGCLWGMGMKGAACLCPSRGARSILPQPGPHTTRLTH